MDESTAVSPDPERAIKAHGKRRNIMIPECRSIPGVEACEADAIESGETEPGTDPKVTVGRLRDRADEVVRQTFVSLPRARRIFG